MREHALNDIFPFLIQAFQKNLAQAERIVVVGNGGIALELV